MSSIRIKVVGVPFKEDCILAGLYRSPKTGECFYCPLGGGMEFREQSIATLHREFQEAIGAARESQELTQKLLPQTHHCEHRRDS